MVGHDLVVVGGGPAGLVAAIHARRRGLSALVLDRGEPGHDKACGEGLMPDAVAQLRALDVVPRLVSGRPFRGIRFVQQAMRAEGLFAGEHGLVARRTDLHAGLVARAQEAGVEIRWRTCARGLTPDGVLTDDGVARGRLVVGADGLHSRVRRWAGLDAGPGPRRRFGLRRHFVVPAWSDLVEVHWADGTEAYVGQGSDNLVGVVLTWDGRPSRWDELIRAFPELRERLGDVVASKDAGAGPLHQRVRGVVSGRVALIGDASGYLDCVSGEGVAQAFRHGEALADAVARGDLSVYVRAHARIKRRVETVARLLLLMGAHPALRTRVILGMSRDDGLLTGLLGAMVPPVRAAEVGRAAARLAWAWARAS
jgi:flavin-dependent dehydrogenase